MKVTWIKEQKTTETVADMGIGEPFVPHAPGAADTRVFWRVTGIDEGNSRSVMVLQDDGKIERSLIAYDCCARRVTIDEIRVALSR